MSLEKAIKSGNEHRKEYRQGTCAAVYGGKGKCDYCRSGKDLKQKAGDKDYKDQIKESK